MCIEEGKKEEIDRFMGIQIVEVLIKLSWGIGLLLSFYLDADPLKFEIKGESAILLNAQTGAILFEYEAHHARFPASTTKVATALYALKLKGDALEMAITAEQEALATISPEGKRKSDYTLPSHWLETDGTHIGLKKDEILTLHDLLRGMLIPSGNDAANVIAQSLGSSIPKFMEGLNAYLKEIGCRQTHFCNPHGLHHPQHVSTAYDLALITREALKNSVFREIVSQARFIRPKTNKQASKTFLQGNRLLRSGKYYYPRAIGVKTGYHSKAKKTFIGAAQANGRTLIAVLLGYQDRQAIFDDAIKLFETAFNQPKVQRLYLKSGLQSFAQTIPRANRTLQTYLAEALSLDYYPAEDPKAKCLLYWHTLSLPITKDQKVGELHLVSAEGVILKQVPLHATEEIQFAWPYNWLAILPSLSWFWIIGMGVIGIAGFFAVNYYRS